MTSKLNFFKNTVAPSSAYSRALLFVVFLLGIICVTWRFGPWMPDAFFGDDLFNLLAYRDGQFPDTISEAVSAAFLEKYRPVFVWLLAVMFRLFDEHIWSYLAVNVVLHAINAAIVFATAHRLSRGDLVATAQPVGCRKNYCSVN